MPKTYNDFQLASISHPNSRVAVLLSRYPDVSGRDLEEIILFLRSATPAEIRALRSIRGVRRKLDRLAADYPDRVMSSSKEFTRSVAAFVMIILICWFAWHMETALSERSAAELSEEMLR